MLIPNRFSEALGLWAGGVIAPMFAFGTLVKQDRLFHARGIHFRAEVQAAEGANEQLTEVVEGLTEGAALVRLSPALWRGDKGVMPDVLGMAIRFGADPANNFEPQQRTTDLTFISARRLGGVPLALLSTNQRDFLSNTYHGAGRYEIAGWDKMRLRLVPIGATQGQGPDRFAKIRSAVEAGNVVFRLETESMVGQGPSTPLVEIRLVEEVDVDEEELAFWPFRREQEIQPSGLIQFMRPIPYLLSQYARQI